jgi:hypothetical protein
VTFKPILSLDFDGVVHSYTSGWQGALNIPDPVVPGFFEWLEEASKYFRIVIYSSRSKEPGATQAMQNWLTEQRMAWREAGGAGEPLDIAFADSKPSASIVIDDRAFRFNGDWAAPELDPKELIKFQPWGKRDAG